MNKTAIKNFAIWARNKLIADISYRASLMGITEAGITEALPQSNMTEKFYDIGTAEPYRISGNAVKQRGELIAAIHRKERDTNYSTAYKYIIEEVAYTWFNRLIAVRFMEVNDYLPSHIRVLSSETGKPEPDLVTTPFDANLDFTGAEEAEIIKLKQDNQLDEVFRILFIKQCNALNEILPVLFEKTGDYTELLFNPSVIDRDGVVWHLLHDIDEADFNISTLNENGNPTGQVEIIGWLYQYYNTELNEQVYDGNMSKSRITKELLPAATTIYTPDWVVKYMVQNSLGHLWLEGHPNSELQSKWKYYLEEAEQEPEVTAELTEIRSEYANMKPEDIRAIDPCMGSGHMLVCIFDALMEIYQSQGYSDRDAVRNIIEYNLYGLDIDDRATQLAYFAVMMKAREYDRRIFSRHIQPHVYAIMESNDIDQYTIDYFTNGNQKLVKEFGTLVDELKDAKEYGSIIKIAQVDFSALYERVDEIKEDISIYKDVVLNAILPLLQVAEVMSQKYTVVITNPPYLGSSRFSPKLDAYVKKNYTDEKADLSMVMFKRAMQGFSDKNGFIVFVTTSSWMFLSSFEKVRHNIFTNGSICSLVDYGTELFEGKVGHNPIVSWVTRNSGINYKMLAVRLVDYCYSRRDEKEPEFFEGRNRYTAQQENFAKIPGSPVAYSLSDGLLETFNHCTVGSVSETRCGMNTGDNDKFLRLWFEPEFYKFNMGSSDIQSFHNTNALYTLYNKGGQYRKWYGNLEYVIKFDKIHYSILAQQGNKLPSRQYYFKPAITWTDLSSKGVAFRYEPQGSVFDGSAAVAFSDYETMIYLLGLLNTKYVEFIAKIINPTMHFKLNDYAKVPYIYKPHHDIFSLVESNIHFSKTDWDSFETSWDFQCHPLIRWSRELHDASSIAATMSYYYGGHPKVTSPLELCYMLWQGECNERFKQLKANEEELNRIFIDIYGLQDELTPEEEDKDVTIRKADLGRDIRSLLSYAVGCMFGRYSLDKPGLVFAGGDFDDVYWKYKGPVALDKNGFPIEEGYGYAGFSLAEYHYPKMRPEQEPQTGINLSYEPDVDNIIPITDEEYLEDDIVSRLCDWLKAAFGADSLEQNLDFIAGTLGNKGNSSREIIRNYFLKDFFKDHCKVYQKRPIYWLFDSGKQNGFKALIYLHRYNADTIGNLRVDYLHRMQRIYDSEIKRMQDMIDNSKNPREVAQSSKRKEKLQKQLKECQVYDELISHLALSRIELDLDDGVKVNYEKVQTARDGKKYSVLAKI